MITPEFREFIAGLRQFDVLRVNGNLRVVRDIHRRVRKPGGKVFVSFAFSILRCSWTTRAYTIMSMYDLSACTVELVGRGYTPKTRVEAILQHDIDRKDRGFDLDCCMVKGVH